MKILHVITSLGVGGAEILLKDLAILFKEKGIDITIIVFIKIESFIADILKDKGIKIIYCPLNSKFSFINMFFLYKHLRKNYYDVLHAHLTWDLYLVAFLIWVLGERKKFKAFATEHSTMMLRRNNFFVRVFNLEKWMYSQYEKIICVTEEVYIALINYLSHLKDKSFVIVNGINLKNFIATYDACERMREPLLLCIGTLCRHKDQITLIRAAYLIDNVKLWFIGDGEDRAKLTSEIARLGLQNRVFLLGKRKDVNDLMQHATIYIQPSLYEGFGIAMVEAMAHGLPVIASNILGLKCLVDNAGFFFPVSDYKSLAAVIRKILKNEKLLQKMSIKSKLKAQNFSIENTAEKYIDLYRGF